TSAHRWPHTTEPSGDAARRKRKTTAISRVLGSTTFATEWGPPRIGLRRTKRRLGGSEFGRSWASSRGAAGFSGRRRNAGPRRLHDGLRRKRLPFQAPEIPDTYPER